MTRPAQPHIALAAALTDLPLTAEPLSAAKAVALPPLTADLLDKLAVYTLHIGLQSPRQGWTLMAAADKLACIQDNDFLAAKAAWYLGRAANEYGRPHLAVEPLNRAETLFTALNEPGWLAAVTWQRHALCWAAPDLALAVRELESAAATLANAPGPLLAYAPHCQLTLAYARLLLGDHDGLLTLLEQLRDTFAAANDPLHQARTLFLLSGLYRRTTPFTKAKEASLEGMVLARSVNAAADIARFHCQIGYNHWLCDGDYEAAADSFQQGIEQFAALNIPGWTAQCQEGLAQIYMMTGRLSEAGRLLQTALKTYQQEQVYGQQAHAWLSAGWLESLKGNYHHSLKHLQQSEAAYQKTGNQKMIPVVQMHLGDTHLQLGRFQQALHQLEQAYSRLESLNLAGRLAECGLRLAHLWTLLGDSTRAFAYLEKVKTHALEAGHASALLAYHFRLAEYHDEQADAQKTLEALSAALDHAQRQQNPHIEAQCRRQLAKTYARQRQLTNAIEQLTLAQSHLNEMELPHEQATCFLIWGDIYHQQGRPQKAAAAWKEAEQISRTLMPDLNWQAAAALAQLTEESGRKAEALDHYRQMIDSLRLLRQGFWQPELAGSYLKRPSAALNQAVLLSAQSGRHADTLTFIEETKAQATARRIQAQALFRELNLMPEAARSMMAEIRWLQEKLRTADTRPLIPFRSAETGSHYSQLREKIDRYIELLNRSQREQIDNSRIPAPDGFQIEQFCRQANQHLGHNWVALDYYQAGPQLVCLVLTPTQLTACPINLSADLMTAIESLQRLQNPNSRLPLAFLADVGRTLIPAAVQEHLHDRKTLLIAPHRDLHRLPWAALPVPGPAYRPLVDAATPVIIPSLHTLSLLWQRETAESKYVSGLLLAVSDFHGRHPPLPAVHQELEQLKPFLNGRSRILLDQEATAPALLAETASYDFWHIASHAFHDEHSGRLSGLALYDRDLWLDELWQLAPLPSLVTFSTCGSSRSHLFEGDEHVSLTTTCLTAGANQVVGSIWNVVDAGIPGIMTDFYTRLRHPKNGTAVPVAEALAQTQRRAWAGGESWPQWAGFRCTGRP